MRWCDVVKCHNTTENWYLICHLQFSWSLGNSKIKSTKLTKQIFCYKQMSHESIPNCWPQLDIASICTFLQFAGHLSNLIGWQKQELVQNCRCYADTVLSLLSKNSSTKKDWQWYTRRCKIPNHWMYFNV